MLFAEVGWVLSQQKMLPTMAAVHFSILLRAKIISNSVTSHLVPNP